MQKIDSNVPVIYACKYIYFQNAFYLIFCALKVNKTKAENENS
ncbi:hypothetical protein F975_02395 [Acinetobacter sp. ANC 3789]|nr:hypothetical protein F975_02395 [Acinetobacter sp. ANC 3789]